MTPDEFVRKWGPGGSAYALNERQGAQPHFMDLCAVLGAPTPDDPDNYCFEKGVLKLGAKRGFADVWKRGHFAWEYKAPPENPHKNNAPALDGALKQLTMYALALENPPLLVVSDRLTIRISTHFTGTPTETHEVEITQLTDPKSLDLIRRLLTDPESFRPSVTSREITEEAAAAFANVAERMRERGVDHHVVAHFLTQCLFCFFADDVRLLPDRLFANLIGNRVDPPRLKLGLQDLFEAMKKGGMLGRDDVPYFNGGLFETVEVPDLSDLDVAALRTASALRWNEIDVSIFGTLFERGLDSAKRSQLGAHYTDTETIMRLVEPVVRKPLLSAWESTRPVLEAHLTKSKRIGDAAYRMAHAVLIEYLQRLQSYRILDPACGSGNFLYLGLRALKDVEHKVNSEAHVLGLDQPVDLVTGPHNVLGIEINEYAAELARVTVWIGELQWRIKHGYSVKTNPVLEPLNHIECRDALLLSDCTEASWPVATVVIGNPPFVGDKKMRAELGDAYTDRLRATFEGRVPGAADLVCFWFEKAREAIMDSRLQAAGLVATNSIRQGANREVLAQAGKDCTIFEAWSDEPWVNDGASLNVSLVAFGRSGQQPRLDGRDVVRIHADLSADEIGSEALDLTRAQPLAENADASYFGFCLAGPFVVPAAKARQWLTLPNPTGRSNAEVLKPIFNGVDLRGRPGDRWTIDFGCTMLENEAAQFDEPFRHAVRTILPARKDNKRAGRAKWWFRHGETRPGLRNAIQGLGRMIVTIETSKHRYFMWLPTSVAPEHKLVVIPREDDVTFGILSSRIHVVWALRKGSTLETRPVYTTGEVFAKFPFPGGLTPRDSSSKATEKLSSGAIVPGNLSGPLAQVAAGIADAAKVLNDRRERWLNPNEWTDRLPEVVPLGMNQSPYPDRAVPRHGHESDVSKLTMTELYNDPPPWLAMAHQTLDAAVAQAYGWTDYSPNLSDQEILRRLLDLNLSRSNRS